MVPHSLSIQNFALFLSRKLSLLIGLLILLQGTSGWANNKGDSISNLLQSYSSPDSNRVTLFISLAEWHEDNGRLDQSLLEFENAIKEAKGLRDPAYLALAYYEFGHYWRHQDSIPEAIKSYLIAAEFYEKTGNQLKLSRCYYRIARLYDKDYHLQEALEYFRKEIALNETLVRQEATATAYNNMAIILKELGNYKESLNHYLNALRINREIGRDKSIARNLNNIGNLFRAQKFFDKAIEYYNEALIINSRIEYEEGMSLNHLNIGRAAFEDGRLTFAQEHLIKGLSEARKVNSNDRILYALRLLAEVQLEVGNLDKALSYIEQSLRRAQEEGSRSSFAKAQIVKGRILLELGQFEDAHEMAKMAYEFFSDSDELEGKLDNVDLLFRISNEVSPPEVALGYATLKDHLKDSLYRIENAKILTQLSAEQEFLKTKIDLEQRALKEQLVAEGEKRNSMVLLIGLIFLLIVTVVVVQLFQRSKSNNKKLESLNGEIEKHRSLLQSRNEQLMRVNDDKNDLISIVAHDLRAPLGNIQGLIKHMRKENSSSSQEEYLDMIERSSGRLIEMTNAVLDMESIEAERLNVMFQKIDLVALLIGIMPDFQGSADEKQIELITEFPTSPVNVLADENFLIPSIENLVNNAIKYSPPRSPITVRVSADGTRTLINVKDTGPGISASDQKRLFSPFQTLSNKPTQNETSTGLGLYITKRYVEAMNGIIRCDSKVGEGTTFEIEFESI